MSRESLCQLGVSFLQNASTQSLPFSEQIQFLEGKGLSAEEIKQALRSVSSSSPPAKKDGWLWNVMFPIMILGAGCTAYVLSKALEEDDYEDQLDFRSEEEDGDSEEIELEGASLENPPLIHANSNNNESDTENDIDLTDGSLNSESVSRHGDSDMGRLVSVLEKQTTAIQQAIELFTVNVSSLAAMSALCKDSTTTDSMSVASDKTPVTTTISKERDDKMGESEINDDQSRASKSVTISAESILADIRQIIDEMIHHGEGAAPIQGSNEGGNRDTDSVQGPSEAHVAAVHRGFSSIIMYIQKIIDNPKISRYHRLSTANSTFKSSVASLPHHEKLLEALGFQKRGAFWEWQSASSSNNNNTPQAKSSQNQKDFQSSEESARLASRDVYFSILPGSISLLEAQLALKMSFEVPDGILKSPSSSSVTLSADKGPMQRAETVVINEESIPIENEIYSKSAASDKDPMKFEEVRFGTLLFV